MNPIIQIWKDVQTEPKDFGTLPTRFLKEYPFQLLSLISEPDFEDFLSKQLGSDDIGRLAPYQSVPEWLRQPTSPDILDPTRNSAFSHIKVLPFLDMLRRALLKGIEIVLEPRVRSGELPSKGVLLAFTSRLRFAYIVTYSFVSLPADIAILDRIANPKAVFDLRHFPDLTSQQSKNAAKQFLTSGHKVILQNGVLSHVDRRLDIKVFGPTIDTVIMAEEVNSLTPNGRKILEVGCGSGHIVTSVAALKDNVQDVVYCDVNPYAMTCTLRNIEANVSLRRAKASKLRTCYGVTGKFEEDINFGQTFDLVISNPPYIAEAPGTRKADSKQRSIAVTGTELLEKIVRSAGKLLSQEGKMLLMTSSCSFDSIERQLPPEFEIIRSNTFDGFNVPFDVEDVLDDPEWLKYLLDSEVVFDHKGEYFHNLIPLWVQRSAR